MTTLYQLLDELRTPEHTLFEKIELVNEKSAVNKPLQILVKPQVNGLVYTSKKQGLNVLAFVHPETGLLVIDETIKTGRRVMTPHQQYHELAVQYCKEQFEKLCNRLNSLKDSQIEDLKPVKTMMGQAKSWFDTDIFKFYKDLHSKLSQLPVVGVPLYNEYIRYAGESSDVNRLTSVTLPYSNPMVNLGRNTDHIDKFMDVFFEEEDKDVFSWYMGAVLCNVELQNDNMSKLLFVHGRSGCGKSSLALGLGKELLTNELIHVASEFDSYFTINNRFSTSSVSSRRLSIYNESKWGYVEQGEKQHKHNFYGLNVTSIQSLISDGYIDSEEKYEKKETTMKAGLHLILTNHIPVITSECDALSRRLLPCMMKPTSMFEKATELNLEGSKFRKYIRDNALDFAVYFVNKYKDLKNKYRHYVYDHEDYAELMSDIDVENKAKSQSVEDRLKDAYDKGFNEFMVKLDEEGFDIDSLVYDLEYNDKDIKKEANTLYINSSKVYFSSISKNGEQLRKIFKNLVGSTVKKHGKRMFSIKLDEKCEPISVNEHFKNKAERLNEKVEKVMSDFVINYPDNKNNLLKHFKVEFLNKYIKLNDKKSKLTYRNVGLITDENLFDIEADNE